MANKFTIRINSLDKDTFGFFIYYWALSTIM